MKALRTILASLAILISAVTVNAQRMSYEAMCDNARFLTDRMAYTLGISSPSLIDDIYRINFDYIYGINDYLDEVAYGYHYDEYMDICYQRDRALQYLLGAARWNRILGYSYFYRPIVFSNYGWRFSIYDYDRYRTHWYFGAPSHYHVYRGGHYFHGMAPRVGHIDIRHGGNHPGFGNRPGGMNPGRPNGGMNPGRPNGGMNPGRPNGGMNPGRPNGGMNSGRPNGNADRPNGNMNNGGSVSRPEGNSGMTMGGRPNLNTDRPSNNSGSSFSGGTRPESLGSGRIPSSSSSNYSSSPVTRSESNNHSSSRPSNFSSGGSSSRPSGGFGNSGGNSRPSGGGHMGGGSRGGGHMGGGRR